MRTKNEWSTPLFGETEEIEITLHAPSVPVFVISLVLAALALLGHIVLIPYFTLYGFWFALIAYAVLAIGSALKT
ncbi:hypothetical protein [Xanthobacter sediminis]